MNMPQNIDGEY